MFEDSTFESAGRIKSKSKYWMVVTFITNGSILLLLILIPLIYPEALPRPFSAFLMEAPLLQPQQPPQKPTVQTAQPTTETHNLSLIHICQRHQI